MAQSRFDRTGHSMVNRNRLSHDENYAKLEQNLHLCLSIEEREYYNRSGQRCRFVEFIFANGKTTLSIENSVEVSNLLNDFMTAQGAFKKISEQSGETAKSPTQKGV